MKRFGVGQPAVRTPVGFTGRPNQILFCLDSPISRLRQVPNTPATKQTVVAEGLRDEAVAPVSYSHKPFASTMAASRDGSLMDLEHGISQRTTAKVFYIAKSGVENYTSFLSMSTYPLQTRLAMVVMRPWPTTRKR